MNNLIPFKFESKSVRVIQDENGDFLFVAKDIAEALDYTWSGTQRVQHVPKEWRGVTSVVTPSGVQEMTVLTEQGLYFFLGRSDKPKALPLQKWVAGEVLPSVRKTGSYSVTPVDPIQLLNDPETLRTLLLTHVTENIELKKENAIIKPKAEALDRLSCADGSQCITDAAKALKVRPSDLFKKLHSMGWIYKRPGGKNWLGYQDKIRAGVVEHKITTILKEDGHDKVTEQVLLTGKGISEISKALNLESKQNDLFRK